MRITVHHLIVSPAKLEAAFRYVETHWYLVLNFEFLERKKVFEGRSKKFKKITDRSKMKQSRILVSRKENGFIHLRDDCGVLDKTVFRITTMQE